jgi:hypothetical protein
MLALLRSASVALSPEGVAGTWCGAAAPARAGSQARLQSWAAADACVLPAPTLTPSPLRASTPARPHGLARRQARPHTRAPPTCSLAPGAPSTQTLATPTLARRCRRCATRRREAVYLRRRLGFVRVAIRAGANLVPVYHLGASQLLGFWGSEAASRRARMCCGLFFGAWGLPLPRRHAILTLVGAPVPGAPRRRAARARPACVLPNCVSCAARPPDPRLRSPARAVHDVPGHALQGASALLSGGRMPARAPLHAAGPRWVCRARPLSAGAPARSPAVRRAERGAGRGDARALRGCAGRPVRRAQAPHGPRVGRAHAGGGVSGARGGGAALTALSRGGA